MVELLRTNDPVRLSLALAVLEGEGLNPLVFDTHASVLDGSVLAVQQRVMVVDDEAGEAFEVLKEAGVLEP